MEEVYIASAVRTAIGKYGGVFRDVAAPRLGAMVVREALKRAYTSVEMVDEVIMGNVISAGLGQNPARQTAIYAGIPFNIGAFTVNKVCGSGMKAVMLAAQAIRAGDADLIAAGGMENMSNSPHLLNGMRWGVRYGDVLARDAMIRDGLTDVYNDYHMGMTGERVSEKYGITREEADAYAITSNERALAAEREGRFREEIVPVEVQGVSADSDECIRSDTTPEKLSKLPPAFKKGGILTAGNSSKLSDGAAALIVVSGRKAKELRIEPMARVVAYGTGGTKPEDIMEAPIPTVTALLSKAGLRMDAMDIVEHNEAYASASIVVARKLGIDAARLNVNGGAVALGHPIGCSGARILVTIVHEMKRRNLRRGLATLCLGGGNAVAVILER